MERVWVKERQELAKIKTEQEVWKYVNGKSIARVY